MTRLRFFYKGKMPSCARLSLRGQHFPSAPYIPWSTPSVCSVYSVVNTFRLLRVFRGQTSVVTSLLGAQDVFAVNHVFGRYQIDHPEA
jgi:hypothetical protein